MRIFYFIVPVLLLASCTGQNNPVSTHIAPPPTVANNSGEIVVKTGSITTISGSLVQPIR